MAGPLQRDDLGTTHHQRLVATMMMEGLTPTAAARELGVHKQHTHRNVRQLQERGLAVRHPDGERWMFDIRLCARLLGLVQPPAEGDVGPLGSQMIEDDEAALDDLVLFVVVPVETGRIARLLEELTP